MEEVYRTGPRAAVARRDQQCIAEPQPLQVTKSASAVAGAGEDATEKLISSSPAALGSAGGAASPVPRKRSWPPLSPPRRFSKSILVTPAAAPIIAPIKRVTDRHPSRPLRSHRPDRHGRHGGGLPRDRHQSRTASRD